MSEVTGFQTYWISPPGETIRDLLDERGHDLEWLAKSLAISMNNAHMLIAGSMPIDERLADGLSESVGASAGFWIERDNIYQEALNNICSIEKEWISHVPYGDMVKKGWISKTKPGRDREKAILDFFGIDGVEKWHAVYSTVAQDYAFRTSLSYESNSVSVSTWLRKAEIESAKVVCSAFDSRGFEMALPKIRRLTNQKDPKVFLPKLQKICAENGVALVVVPSISGSKASGATRLLPNSKAIIVLSARHLTEDHFWFTFFHEAAHLILHKYANFTLDFNNSPLDSEDPRLEEEANSFAEEILIPKMYRDLLMVSQPSWKDITRISVRIGVSPGIVVGQMQHKGYLPRNWLNFIKRRYKWVSNELTLVRKDLNSKA